MIEGCSDYMNVEVYSSNEKDLTISQASRRWGQRLADTYGNVTSTNYNFTDTTHCGKRYTRHGYTQFIIPDVLPGVTKN